VSSYFERRVHDEPPRLSAEWETNAPDWIEWARRPGHDSYWRFHRTAFLELLPSPGRRTLDIGCGEGRVARDLKSVGHTVVGVDASPTLVEAASSADPSIEFVLADAAALPFPDGYADLAVAFMSLQDIDDVPTALEEAARVLEPGGRVCLAIVHPLGSAGKFEGNEPDAPFVVRGSYIDCFHYRDEFARDGLEVVFESEHRPVSWYIEALTGAGFLVERLREIGIPDEAVTDDRHRRWQRLPLFLHVRAVRP
jgi:SAM-dependent methyltransferase